MARPTADAEEAENGNIYTTAGALDLVYDSEPLHWRGNQIIALHFSDVQVPFGAQVVEAHVQFTARTTDNVDPCMLTVAMQESMNPAAIGWGTFDISGRPLTPALVRGRHPHGP
jgi:hypothetical protein